MCGISGGITLRSDVDLESSVRMFAEAQRARGPDALHVAPSSLLGCNVVLGHNRLSIIDLDARADQPMSDGSGRFDIVFNGEIYNYVEIRQELQALGVRFRTTSDTEVLLEAYAAWGEEAFARFIGMFAVGLVDRAKNRLVLLRDRFGVKPLHYWTDGRTLAFASTAGALARWAGLKPDLGYLTRGLAFKYYDDETTQSPFVGLNCVEPGTYVVVTPREGEGLTTRAVRYYDLAQAVESEKSEISGLDFPALEERLLLLLKNACDIRMRADVQVGVSLSGGVDSTAIAALVGEGRSNLLAYSFADPQDKQSEGPLVETFSKAAGIETRYVAGVDTPGDVEVLFWATYKAQEAPFSHSSVMAQHAVFRAARKDGVKVLLGGQGGDEAFMGYRKFYLFHARSILQQRAIWEGLRFAIDSAPFVAAVLRRAGVFWSERRRYFGAAEGMGTRLALPPSTSASPGLATATPRDRQMLDVTRYSLPTLLRYEDRNSLGNSVESRLPFIDHRIVAFGLALPERAKLSGGYGKWIVRHAMRGRAPDAIMLNRDKRGFDVDQNGWIADGGLGRVLRAALNERKAGIADFLPQGAGLDDLFSDAMLRRDSRAFREAVSLIWVGDWR